MGTAELHYLLKTSSELRFWGRLLVLWHHVNILFFFFFFKCETAENLDRREGDGGCFGLKKHGAFDLGAELSVPSGGAHGATAPWGRWGG